MSDDVSYYATPTDPGQAGYLNDPDMYYNNPNAGATDGGDNFQYGNGGVGAPGASGGFWNSLLSALGSNAPGLLNTLAGIAGPVAGLAGTLASGGQTGTQNVSSNVTGSETGSTNENRAGFSNTTGTRSGTTNENRTTTETGYETRTPTLDPRASATADRLNAALGGDFGGAAQGMYGGAMSLMNALAGGGGAGVVTPRAPTMPGAPSAAGAPSAGSPGAVNTTPRPAAVTGFPNRLPSDLDTGLVNLIKQAFGSFTGDIANSAITNARARGFAGGADLLGTAAAPIASGALAQVPAQQAKAYLEQALGRYTAESENAARKAAAEANALNAATNALQPGIQQYTADSNRLASQYGADSSRIASQYGADSSRMASMYGTDTNRYLGELDANSKDFQNKLSLITAMMGPQKDWMNANLGLLNALPAGSNTMSGRTGNSSLSGSSNSAEVTNQVTGSSLSGNTSRNSNETRNGTQTNNQPMGPAIANGIGNIIAGAGIGAASGQTPQAQYANSLLRAMTQGS